MVGLVVVGHSRALARAAVDLAGEMLHGQPVPIEVAAGLDDTAFGTDAVAIGDAVTAADDGDGVVVLMDLGSALLSAELALEMLDDGVRDRVVLSPAPLVEGLIAAAVAAAGGAGRAEVAAEAAAALAGKQTHLGTPPPAPDPTGSTGTGPTVTVTNPHGLHARPAARLVATVRAFDARVEIRNASTGSTWVPAASLSRVATIGALRGHEIEVRATGPQARAAVDAVAALAARAFDESEAVATPDGPADARWAGAGQPASPGIVIGPARQWRSSVPDVPDVASRGVDAEWGRMSDALAAVRREVRRTRDDTARDAGESHAAIFYAHLLLLDDADLLGDARSRIEDGSAAPRAWADATDRVAADFEALDDPYLKVRAADVRAVAGQVLRAMLGGGSRQADAYGVVIATDLTPAEAAGLEPGRVAGVLLAYGSPTSHAAILARTRGVPAVVGLGPAILQVADGTPVAADGATGEVVLDPPEQVLTGFRRRAAEQAARRERAAARASAPAVTRDGVTVAVGANVGSAADARAAAASGADLAGLVRTEFLFVDRDAAPDADEQQAAYAEIAAALGGRRITLRTLDVGGDKPLRYLPTAAEANPFLGVRGLRHSLAHPHLLDEQLVAIVRVAREVPVSVLFPMVSTVDEVIRARRALDEAVARTGGGTPAGMHVGIMVEVPAAALKAATFAAYVDFVSVGTNDLTQYALAAERGNAELAALADPLDPGVLRLVDAVCRDAAGRFTVAVCGEVAGDETAVPLLTALGVRELSMAPGLVPAAKEAVRATDLAAAVGWAGRAVRLADGAAVRAMLAENRPARSTSEPDDRMTAG